ncbi:hypothetical protein Glove_228g21 [Diversispora epigaea]|uniref:Uncharacterized protein n=1 Tax=Diversispora epigaea TaxID=1348612 RepID=A0A397IGB0_9GLOM|nr:hypothetical protein Glove_228g21 [Diversispora epigaea]
MYLIPNRLQILLLNYNGNKIISIKFNKDIVNNTEFIQTEEEDELSFASTSSSRISAEQ